MFRKTSGRRLLAGVVAGALTVGTAAVGVIALPGASSAAEPSTEHTQTADLRCTYSTYGTTYAGTVTTTVGEGGALSMTATDIGSFGMPPSLSISKITSTVTATVDGEAVSLTGVTNYDPKRAGNLDLPVPTATATRTGSGPISTVTISKLVLGMSVYFGPSGPIPANLNCVPAVHTTTAATATSTTPNSSTLSATVTPSTATGAVDFYEGATKVGSKALTSGAASIDLTGVAAGDHSYVAKYVPTSGTAFVPSESAPATAGVAPGAVTQTADLRCTYSTYGTTYAGSITTTPGSGGALTMTMGDIGSFGMPASLSISKITSTVTATVNGEAVSLTGVTNYDPKRAGNLDLPVPNATATRTGTGDLAPVVISKLVLGMSVYFGPSGPIPANLNCVPAVHTTTASTATSATPNSSTLSATVTPSTATGSVDFYEGATKVGSKALTDGAASVDLTGVSAGDHSYVAKYVPTNGSAFVPSEAAPVATAVAPGAVTQTADLRCTYSTYGTTYAGSITTTPGDAGALTMTMGDIGSFGMPPSLSISRITSTVTATVNGEAVTLTGAKDYDPKRAANLDLPVPNATATRTGTGDLAPVVISKLVLGMSVYAGPSGPIPANLNCVPAVHTTTSATATSPATNATTLSATVVPSTATGSIDFYEGETKVGSKALTDGAASIDLAGVSAGDHTYVAKYVPTSGSAFVPSEAAPVTTTVTQGTISTSTALTATSSAPNAATLSSTVSPGTATGTVDFYEGETKVGSKALASGAASIDLTDVSAGEHSYVAKYVPTEESDFLPSQSSASVVTVADEPVEPSGLLDYTCVIEGPAEGPSDDKNLASTLDIELTDVPATVTAGQELGAHVDLTLVMKQASAGPVTELSGDLEVDLTVGGQKTTVTIPVTPGTMTPGTPKDMTFAGSDDVTLTAPTGTGAADIEVGKLTGKFVAAPFGLDTVIPCTAAAEQDQTVGSTTVEEAPPVVPDGLKYACAYQNWMFPAYIDTAATLPSSVKQGATFNPAVTSTVTWVDDLDSVDWKDDVTLPSGYTWESWPASSRSTLATYKDGVGVLHTATNGTAGTGTLGFASLPVTETGDMVWAATGTYGAVSTSTVGARSLSVGDIDLTVMTKNKFTGPGYLKSEIDCALLPEQDTALGSVTVEAVPTIGLSGGKVTGTNKVGQKLTASLTSDPADAAKAYQWLRNGAAISGATAATYTAVPADLAKTLSVRVTVTKADFQSAAATIAVGKVAAGVQKVTGRAKATGTAKVGKKLTAVPGKATGATVKYQWLVNGKVVKKATAKTMKLTKALKGKKISVKVTYIRAGYATVTQTSAALKVK